METLALDGRAADLVRFRRADLNCLKCHAIAGAGGQIGPGLESIGANAPVDYLLTLLIQPDKAIKEGYHSLVVATGEGAVVSGIAIRQTDDQLVLRDAEDVEATIPTSTIEDQKPGGSLMPAGLTGSLDPRRTPGPDAGSPRSLGKSARSSSAKRG